MCNCTNEVAVEEDTSTRGSVYDDIALFESNIITLDEVRQKYGYAKEPEFLYAVVAAGRGSLWHIYRTKAEAERAALLAEEEVGESWCVLTVEMDLT